MAHHIGNETTSLDWSQICNDLIQRVVRAVSRRISSACASCRSRRASRRPTVRAELERCVKELGFIGCNLNPDPSGGHWTAPPLTDRTGIRSTRRWCELDVPAMVHVSSSCNPNFHATGAHYINADTTAFMQFLTGGPVQGFPDAAVHHSAWRRRSAVPLGPLPGPGAGHEAAAARSIVLKNVFFDTCVYHQPGIDLLLKVMPVENILFGSEMVGAVRGIDPETGHYYDDTKRYIDALSLDEPSRRKVFEGNARHVYPRLRNHI